MNTKSLFLLAILVAIATYYAKQTRMDLRGQRATQPQQQEETL